MARLVAKRPVLWLSRQYAAGDVLPTNRLDMISAWIEAGSAEWQTEAEKKPKAEKPDYGNETHVNVLRDIAKEIGIVFKVGTRKMDMISALDSYYSNAEIHE